MRRRRKRIIGGTILGVTLVAGVAVGTGVGSAGGPYDGWGCPADRIGVSVNDLMDGGGSKTQADALLATLSQLVEDGDQTLADYSKALASIAGPTRHDPTSGHLFVDGQLKAQLTVSQLADGTWAVSRLVECMGAVPPELASPYPTPSLGESRG